MSETEYNLFKKCSWVDKLFDLNYDDIVKTNHQHDFSCSILKAINFVSILCIISIRDGNSDKHFCRLAYSLVAWNLVDMVIRVFNESVSGNPNLVLVVQRSVVR